MTEQTHAVETTKLGGVIAPLCVIVALGQFEIAVSLPSLPAIARDLGVSTSLIQLSVSSVYAGFGLIQLIGGVLVERFGRRILALAGLILFVVATVAAAVSATVNLLLILRFLQGSGCALAIVAARAAARDRYDGVALRRALATLNIASALLSGLGTVLGGVLQDRVGWRGAFLSAAVAGAGVLALTLFAFPRSSRASRGGPTAWRAYQRVLSSPAFLAAMAVAFSLSVGEFALFLSAPPIFEIQFGLTPTQFGLLPPLLLVAYSAGAVLAARAAGRWTDRRIGLLASTTAVAAALVLLLLAASDRLIVATALLPMSVFVFAVGLAVPAATAMAIRPFKDVAGPASAAMGVLLIAGVLLGSVVASLRLGSPAVTAAIAMTCSATVALVCVLTEAREATVLRSGRV